MFIKTDAPKRIARKARYQPLGLSFQERTTTRPSDNNYPDRYVAMIARADIQIFGLFELRQDSVAQNALPPRR